ncbi:MAG TPA: cupin domain-containing protein [Vicinamibacterales bacterium]|nr:cupin domain-containing protein [Vicinamibacterales bacterium]
MRGITLYGLSAVLTVLQGSARTPPTSAVDVTAADIRAVVKQAPAEGVMDQQIRVVDMGKYNVAVGVLHRSAKARQTSISHAQVTEVYYIIDGSGTFVTGGTMVQPTPSPADGTVVKILVGPSTNGSAIQDGQSRKVGPGDVVIVPPGVAHWFSAMESDMNYLVMRVDADHVLPAGYVNPAVSQK